MTLQELEQQFYGCFHNSTHVDGEGADYTDPDDLFTRFLPSINNYTSAKLQSTIVALEQIYEAADNVYTTTECVEACEKITSLSKEALTELKQQL